MNELSFSVPSWGALFAAWVGKLGFCGDDSESTGRNGARCFRGLVLIDSVHTRLVCVVSS
jgi:hypothetical protein